MADSLQSPPRKRRRWFRWLLVLLLTPALLFTLYLWLALTWSYSTGDRAGYVQKFSKKGWVFKTWEGELAMVSIPGTMPEKFAFSVRDDSAAAQISRSMGRRVRLTYDQHVGIPVDWFAETEYYVTSVQVIE
jgi:hypothetical protein